MAFSDTFLRQLEDRNGIEDVVSSYVQLTRRSGTNIFGLCPFHNEKTPSFSVRPERNSFYCFGCGKGGGVVNFIMAAENLSYPDAVRHLAKRSGMQMPEETDSGESRKRARMLELNRDAARHFHQNLTSSGTGARAQEYLRLRNISPASVRSFGLGHAPDSWDDLTNAMKALNYTESELTDAGLVRRGKNGGVYDTFRDRLMFPVVDVRGDVIGFSGRSIGSGEPKYMNSPETLVFVKSRNLFGLNLAKKSKNGYIILTEGNIDVVSLHQSGFDSAVASLGTALTAEQARLIRNYVPKVILAYDSDNAGKTASQRAITLLEKLDIEVRVLALEGAKDPDEFIERFGSDALHSLIAGSKNHVEYRLDLILARYDLEINDERVKFLAEATELIAGLSANVEREIYCARAAELAGVGSAALAEDVRRQRERLLRRAKQSQQRELTRIERGSQPLERENRYDNLRSAKAEEGIIRLLFLEADTAKYSGLPPSEQFSSELLGSIYSAIIERRRNNGDVSLGILSAALPPEAVAHLTRILEEPVSLQNSEQSLADYIRTIRDERERNEMIKATPEYSLALATEYRKTKGYGDVDNG